MKKLLLSVLFLITFISYSQTLRDSVLVKTDIFEVSYSEKLEQPLRVKYRVICHEGKASRQGMDFYTEKSYKTSDSKDYENNIYDKGHCAPAADFNCDRTMLLKTFTYLNCALQDQYLNRGTWRLLEVHERELAKNYIVDVEIKLIFSDKSIKLPTGATVPDAFIKTIKYNGVIEKYYFINEKPKHSDYKLYIIK
jgi:endonuclease G